MYGPAVWAPEPARAGRGDGGAPEWVPPQRPVLRRELCPRMRPAARNVWGQIFLQFCEILKKKSKKKFS